MIKRIILEELSGLRRIGGVLDIPADGDYELPKHVAYKNLTCYWVRTGPRSVTYREFDPASREAEGGAAKNPTPSTENS